MIINILFLLLLTTIIVPVSLFYFGERKVSRFKNMLFFNIFSFFSILIFCTIFIFSGSINAAQSIGESSSSATGMAYLAAAIVTGLCTLGTGIATGQAASAALGTLSENEKLMGKALIFVALAEGTAVYGLIVSFTILGRV